MRKTIKITGTSLNFAVEHKFDKIKRVKESEYFFDVSCKDDGFHEIVAWKEHMSPCEIKEFREFCEYYKIEIRSE